MARRRLHEAGVTAGDFGTVYAADARGIGYALRPVVFAVGHEEDEAADDISGGVCAAGGSTGDEAVGHFWSGGPPWEKEP